MQPAKPVTIRGRRYASVSDAARANGVTRRAIQLAMANGTLDYVGMGRGLHGRAKLKEQEDGRQEIRSAG